ncbi:hypothetical protein MARPO_0106s0001 [Marchantia polymorpha]|uniref:Fungal lipase-like domain-containing protein n=1 Tax=Marchantia polymorpha TaxID=3197 RepID=A0A2R6WD64_MARPO|nr:hypothetical protein MARPO_0106s0001 [Marchantia polymorpha]|eukprot:PTQ31795.1 hypothetical protein MARPO_0106s0001 [Marchantia polymorpha]
MSHNKKKKNEAKAQDPEEIFHADYQQLDEREKKIKKRAIYVRLVYGIYDRCKAKPPEDHEEWWTKVHYQLLPLEAILTPDERHHYAPELKDESKNKYFGVFLRNEDSPLAEAPEWVVAIRGTKFSGTKRALVDIENNVKIVLEKLNSSTLIRLLKHVVWRLGEENRYCNVDVTGHSLGAAAGLLVCRRLALDGCVVEGHFFNPPLITLDSLARTFAPWEVYDAGRRIGKKVLPAEDRTERRKTAKEEFYRLENWSPYLYVNKYDLLGCKFVSNLKKPIHETVDGDQSWYKRLYPYSNEFTQMLVGKTESYHLFPSAHLVTIKAYSRLRPYSAHRLSNWIHPNLKYDFKHVKADDIQKFSSQCSMSPEEGPNMEPEEIGTDDEGPSEVSAEDECSSDGSAEDECPSDGSAEDPMGKGEEQGGDTEVEISSQGLRPPRQPPMYTPSGARGAPSAIGVRVCRTSKEFSSGEASSFEGRTRVHGSSDRLQHCSESNSGTSRQGGSVTTGNRERVGARGVLDSNIGDTRSIACSQIGGKGKGVGGFRGC